MAYTVQMGNRAFNGYRGNIHMHTTASDGALTYEEIAKTAEQAGLDYVVITDHNVYVSGEDGWRGKTLILVGEEVHDEHREPPSSHLLCLGLDRDVAHLGPSPQDLIDTVAASGGLTFLAHPFERDVASFLPEPNISWRDWEVSGYTGIELWNYMSEFKSLVRTKAQAVVYTYAPKLAVAGPYPEALRKWDLLLRSQPVPVLGGSDAHGTVYRLGPFSRAVQPHAYLFRCINTYLLTEVPLTGDLESDKKAIFGALAAGNGYVGYERIGDPEGFTFWARSDTWEATMGETLMLRESPGESLELRVTTPGPARLRLIRDGTPVAQSRGDHLTLVTRKAGTYRVEAYRRFAGRERGWLFSNPIYVRKPVVDQSAGLGPAQSRGQHGELGPSNHGST
ncbi:CehA/McbA family metallohydrolase [Chloroflexota bacterium]